MGFCSCNEKWQQWLLKPNFLSNNRIKTYSSKCIRKFSIGSKKFYFFPGIFGCLNYEIAIKGTHRNICYFGVFIYSAAKSRSLPESSPIKGPYSCEVKTWIIISNGKLKKQKLKLVMSIILWEKLNAWQPPNVSRRLHNYSKLMYGHTYKLVSKYFKLTVYLGALCSFFSVRFVSDYN